MSSFNCTFALVALHSFSYRGFGVQDLYRILTEPETNMIRQQQLLMKTEDIDLVFTDEAIEELAAVAAEVQTHSPEKKKSNC